MDQKRKSPKVRLDVLLVDRGLFDNRSRASAAILAGDVSVDGMRRSKAGEAVAADAQIDVKSRPAWVSRSAEKIAGAFDRFGLSCAGKIALDVGAGSGGFTQILLERGAAKVYAVDVGYGQFDARLRNDSRVILLERKNARDLTRDDIPDNVEFLSMDVSFISIFLILPAVRALLDDRAEGIILFKPNFEAAKGEVQKGGMMLDAAIHLRLLTAAVDRLPAAGFCAADLMPSPIRGRDGNIEYLLFVRAKGSIPADPPPSAKKIADVIDRAFADGPGPQQPS